MDILFKHVVQTWDYTNFLEKLKFYVQMDFGLLNYLNVYQQHFSPIIQMILHLQLGSKLVQDLLLMSLQEYLLFFLVLHYIWVSSWFKVSYSFKTNFIPIDCMYPRRKGSPEWTWTGWFRQYLTGE